MLFFPGWNTLLAGFLVANNEMFFIDQIRNQTFEGHFWISSLVLTMVVFMAAMGGSFVLNQVKDVQSDQKNKKLFILGEKHINVRAAIFESIFLLSMSLLISLSISFVMFVLIAAFILITGYLYNFKPFNYKDRPIGGLLLNILMGWIAFTIGWVVKADLNMNLIIESLPYFFLNTSLYFLTIVPDSKGDELSGKKTFCVRFGMKTTIRVSFLFYIVSLILCFILNDQFLLIVNLLILYWMFYLLLKVSIDNAIKAVKMAIFFFSIIICLKFPTYFLLMVGFFYLTKFYYQKRFQFNYPNFRGE